MAGRRLVTYIELPKRSDPRVRLGLLDADVRAAADEGRTKSMTHAQRFTTTGWALDEDSWEMGVLGDNSRIIVSAVVRRED
jgi:hypothetical protein